MQVIYMYRDFNAFLKIIEPFVHVCYVLAVNIAAPFWSLKVSGILMESSSSGPELMKLKLLRNLKSFHPTNPKWIIDL